MMAATAPAAPTSAAPTAPATAAFAAAPTLAAGRAALVTPASAADAAPAAPATATDSPQSRRLSIRIPPAALLLPLAAAALYLLATRLPASHSGSERPVEPAAVRAEIAAPEQEPAAAERVAAAGTAATGAEISAPAGPELSSAELVRSRERAQRAAAKAQQLSDARDRVKVTLYYADRCQHCSEAQAYFVAHAIHAQARDIDKDPRARARYHELNPRGSLPTIEVEGQVLPGFDAPRLERALDRAARARIRRGR
jgi:glutaredoxin